MTTVAQTAIDLSPLIPVLNGLITAAAGVLTAAVPVIAYYAIVWIRAHGIAVSQQTQNELVKRADVLIQNGLKYSVQEIDAEVPKLDKVSVSNPIVASAANYAISQAPDLLKKLGYDTTTKEGQASVVRMVTARLVPSLPPSDTQVNVTVSQTPETPMSDGNKTLRIGDGAVKV